MTTDAAGNGPFVFAFATQPAGSFFTATVTAPTGDTSELSKALILGGTAPAEDIFSNGFETGTTGLWSSHTP